MLKDVATLLAIKDRSDAYEALRSTAGFSRHDVNGETDRLEEAEVEAIKRQFKDGCTAEDYHRGSVRLFRHYWAIGDRISAEQMVLQPAFLGNTSAIVEEGRFYLDRGRVWRDAARWQWRVACGLGSREARDLLADLDKMEGGGTPHDEETALERTLEIIRLARSAWEEDKPTASKEEILKCFALRDTRRMLLITRRLLCASMLTHKEYRGYNDTLRLGMGICEELSKEPRRDGSGPVTGDQ